MLRATPKRLTGGAVSDCVERLTGGAVSDCVERLTGGAVSDLHAIP